jgi:hypothetical protein
MRGLYFIISFVELLDSDLRSLGTNNFGLASDFREAEFDIAVHNFRAHAGFIFYYFLCAVVGFRAKKPWNQQLPAWLLTSEKQSFILWSLQNRNSHDLNNSEVRGNPIWVNLIMR